MNGDLTRWLKCANEPCKGLGRNRQAESLTYTGSGSGVRRLTALAATLSKRFTLVYECSKTTRIVTVSNTDRAAPLVVERGRLTAHVESNSKDRNWDTCVEPIEKRRVTSHSESNIFEFIACSLSLGRIALTEYELGRKARSFEFWYQKISFRAGGKDAVESTEAVFARVLAEGGGLGVGGWRASRAAPCGDSGSKRRARGRGFGVEFGRWLVTSTERMRSRSPCGVRTRDECTKRSCGRNPKLEVRNSKGGERRRTALGVRPCYHHLARSPRVRDVKLCRELRNAIGSDGGFFEIGNIQ